MAEKQENSQQTAGTQPVAQQPQARPCPQDCRMCGMNQQIYCSTQMLFNLSRAQQEMSKRMSLIELAMDDIKEQTQPKQEEEAQFSVPFSE